MFQRLSVGRLFVAASFRTQFRVPDIEGRKRGKDMRVKALRGCYAAAIGAERMPASRGLI
jgi:hypothetical protein